MLSRGELFAKLGLIQVVERITGRAYAEIEEQIWRLDLENSPHGEPWHTSFHASSFPGDDELACGRKAVYGLLNLPTPAPTGRFLRSVADSGKAIEDELVTRWDKAGYLLSASVDAEVQTGFVDEEHWLTGNCDAIVLPNHWRRPHVVEVKSKSQTKIDEMKSGQRGPDPKHRLQCLTYVSFAHEQHPWKSAQVCRETWRIPNDGVCLIHNSSDCLTVIDLEPCESGSIFYVSRDDPSQTHEFFFKREPDFLEQGRAKIKEWKESFEAGLLPDRPRHEDGKLVGWSEEPCKWCPLKKEVCKKDWQDKIITIEQSHAVEFVKSIRPYYELNKTIEAVKERWVEH
jgi:hypothetical protein